MDLNELLMGTFGLSEEDLQKLNELEDDRNVKEVFADQHKTFETELVAFMGLIFSELLREMFEYKNVQDEKEHLQKIKLRLEVIKLLREEVRNGGEI